MKHSGVMICLPLPEAVANSIVIEGGEAASDMHVTLAYIPKIGGDLEKRAKLQQAISPLANVLAPITGMIGGTGRFNGSETSDFKDVFYASFDSSGLEELRRAVLDAVEKAGFEVSKKHGFTPHITLKYLEADEASPRLVPRFPAFEIDQLALADGESWADFEFTGTIILKGQPTSSGVHVPTTEALGGKKKKKKVADAAGSTADDGEDPAQFPVAAPQVQSPGWEAIPEDNLDVDYEDALKELVVGAFSNDESEAAFIPIAKFDMKKQICYGVVLEPDTEDMQGDCISAEEIEKTAHDYLIHSRKNKERHKAPLDAVPVESYLAPEDIQFRGGPYGDQLVRKGSWVLGVKIMDPRVWKMVEDGEYTGFSVGGLGVRDPV